MRKKSLVNLLLSLLVVGCGESQEEKAAKSKAAAEAKSAADWKIIEKVLRDQLKKLGGELTGADLVNVTSLYLHNKQLTDVPKRLLQLSHLEDLAPIT